MYQYYANLDMPGYSNDEYRRTERHRYARKPIRDAGWSSLEFERQFVAAGRKGSYEPIHCNGGDIKNANSYLERNKPNIFNRAATIVGQMMYRTYKISRTVVKTLTTVIAKNVSPSKVASKYRLLLRGITNEWPWIILLLLSWFIFLLWPVITYAYKDSSQLNTQTVFVYSIQEKPEYFETHKILELLRDAELKKRMKKLEDWAISGDSKFETFDSNIKSLTDMVKKLQITIETGDIKISAKKMLATMLEVYDAEKIDMVDYALQSAGGQVISTKCTKLYQMTTKIYSVLGIKIWWTYTAPGNALTPGSKPGECWAFQAFPGHLVVRLYATIEVTGFTIEHMSRLQAANGKIDAAPKNFLVYGLLDELDENPHLFGNYIYDVNGTSNQYFPVQYKKTRNIDGIEYPVAFNIVELKVESNHGNLLYTCVHRFRVHGNPMSNTRPATEDSIRGNKNF